MEMTIERAVQIFAVSFGDEDKKLNDGVIFDVCSGGVRQKAGGLPALFLHAQGAIDSYYKALMDFPGNHAFERYHFLDKPVLNKYQVTMADLPRVSHRVVDDRYAVESRIMIKY